MFSWLFGKKDQQSVKEKEKLKDESIKRSRKQPEKKWIMNVLIQFLVSKQWRINILNFVDNNCIIFNDEEENKFQYTTVHNRFKQIVAGLFDRVMDAQGLDQKYLTFFIDKGLKQDNKKIFEQLLYVDDFLKFKSMMLKRNKELEKQALNQLSKKRLLQGCFLKARVQENQKQSRGEILEEEQWLNKVVKFSLPQKEDIQRISQRDKYIQIGEKRKVQNNTQSSKQNFNRKLREGKQCKEIEKQIISQGKLRILLQNREKELEQRRISELNILKEKLSQTKIEVTKCLQQSQLQEIQQLNDESIQNYQQIPSKRVPTQQQIQQRKNKIKQIREIIKNKKFQQRNLELLSKTSNQKFESILIGENGIEDRLEKKSEKHNTICESEIERRRNLIKRIKDKMIEDA